MVWNPFHDGFLAVAGLSGHACSRVCGACFGLCCAVKDALAVESGVRVVRDACQRQLGTADKEAQADGLTAEQFQAACEDLSKEKGFRNFKELAEDKGLAAAVYSRYMDRTTTENQIDRKCVSWFHSSTPMLCS